MVPDTASVSSRIVSSLPVTVNVCVGVLPAANVSVTVAGGPALTTPPDTA